MFEFKVSLVPALDSKAAELAAFSEDGGMVEDAQWTGSLAPIDESNHFMDQTWFETHPAMRAPGAAYASEMAFSVANPDMAAKFIKWRDDYGVERADVSMSYVQLHYTASAPASEPLRSYLVFCSQWPINFKGQSYYYPALDYLGLVSVDQVLVAELSQLFVHNLYVIDVRAFEGAVRDTLNRTGTKLFGSATDHAPPVVVINTFEAVARDIKLANETRISSEFYLNDAVLKSLFNDRHAGAQARISSYTQTGYGSGADTAAMLADADADTDTDAPMGDSYEEREVHFCTDAPSLGRADFADDDRIFFTVSRSRRRNAVVGLDLPRRRTVLRIVAACCPHVDTTRAVRVECRPTQYGHLKVVGAVNVGKPQTKAQS